MTGPDNVSEAWRALGRQLADLRKAAGYTQHSLAPKTISAQHDRQRRNWPSASGPQLLATL